MAVRRSVGWSIPNPTFPHQSVVSSPQSFTQPHQWREFNSPTSNRSSECMDWLDLSPENSASTEQASRYRWHRNSTPITPGALNSQAGGAPTKGERTKSSPSSLLSMLNISEALMGGAKPPPCHAEGKPSYIRLPAFTARASTPFGGNSTWAETLSRKCAGLEVGSPGEDSEPCVSERCSDEWMDDSRMGHPISDMSVDETLDLSVSETAKRSVGDLSSIGNSSRVRRAKTCKESNAGGNNVKAKAGGKSASRARRFVFWCLVVFIGVIAAALVYQSDIESRSCAAADRIDLDLLNADLRAKVFGQDLAVRVVSSALREFFSGGRRMLVLSFHGWTGIGKNHVANVIAGGMSCAAVHKLIVPLHFAHASEDDAANLHAWIVGNATTRGCGLRLFVIDEVDKADTGLVDSLRDALANVATILNRSDQDGSTLNELGSVAAESRSNGKIATYSVEDAMTAKDDSKPHRVSLSLDENCVTDDARTRGGCVTGWRGLGVEENGVKGHGEGGRGVGRPGEGGLAAAGVTGEERGASRVIVLLLSNTGGSAINAHTAAVLGGGGRREDVTRAELMTALDRALLHPWYERLLAPPTPPLIDALVPFLPLERRHVAQCVRAAFRARGVVEVKDGLVDEVLDRLAWFPPGDRQMFSTAGCRRVPTQVDLVLG